MAAGGMYDSSAVASTVLPWTRQWLVPHFEKMLTTRAARPAVLHAWLLTGEKRYRVVAEQTLDYMVRRKVRLPSGGFASSQDADTDGVEGLTYTWTARRARRRSCCSPSSNGRSNPAAESLDSETRGTSAGDRGAATAAGPSDDKGHRSLERARARSASQRERGASERPTFSPSPPSWGSC